MAEDWFKALGGKLLKTGAAYLQQVRLVQELKSMPAEQARERFTQYVRGLSTSARAGFTLTLAALANNERQADAKRFVESLRAALANPAAWSTGEAIAAPVAAAPPAQPHATLQQDLQRMDEWAELDDAERESAVEQYLTRLGDEPLSAFQANLAEALDNCAQRIAEHHKNEARIAAGRFIEDQRAYMMGRLAGRPPDADWLAGLRNYEHHQASIEAMHGRLAQVLDQRHRQPPPSEERGDGPKAEAALPAAGAAEDGPSPQVQALRQMLEQELAAGTVRADRAVAYRRMLDKIESAVAAKAPGAIAAAAAVQPMQEMIADFMPHLADPGTASLKATPRGREILRYAGALKLAVLREAKRAPPTAATAEALGAVLDDLTRAQTEAAAARDDDALAALEATLLRPAARNWHDLALIRHALLARPLWQNNEVTREVNTLFVAGVDDLLPMIEDVCRGKRLQLDLARRLQNHGQRRWDALNASHVALLDLRGAPRIPQLAVQAPKRARELTGAAYELGWALALGKPIVVLASPGEELPFDVDLSPLLIDGTDDDASALARSLDEAFYVSQRDSRANAIPDALAELDRLTQDHPQRGAIEGMGWLDPALKSDPAGFAAAVPQVLRTIDDAQRQLLRPAWPGVYPDAARPSCFHVMPYRPDWAEEVSATARSVCRQAEIGLEYRIGKESDEGRIVHAIWDDLCRASVVLVELGGGNLNVMIELGIAHALGRPVVLVQRLGEPDVRPLHIEKLRVHMYDGVEQLAAILGRWLKR